VDWYEIFAVKHSLSPSPRAPNCKKSFEFVTKSLATLPAVAEVTENAEKNHEEIMQ
jgi:hypothetical protein